MQFETVQNMNARDAGSTIQVRNTTICVFGLLQENDYGCHDLALEGLNIYDVMEDFDISIWNYLYGDKWRYPMDTTPGINHLTPEENQEAYKNWQYFKKNQRGLTEQ